MSREPVGPEPAAVAEDEIDDPSDREDDDQSARVRYTVSSYGADYPVDSLVKRLVVKDIDIPGFQRGYVWTWTQASRFIESLLLGLPVPGIFLSRDPDTERLFVIDGQQRLLTLRQFYDGVLGGREFKLAGVKEEFEGLTYKTLAEDDRRRLDDSIIHVTIVKQEDPKDDSSSIYFVFERLNTGGTPLSPQEMRACVYQGDFSALLRDLNENESWRRLYGPRSKRLKDQEMILRFFALYYELDGYKRPMKQFLTDFMALNRHLELYTRDQLKRLFERAVPFAVDNLGPGGFRPERALNASATDAILVATARRLEDEPLPAPRDYRKALEELVGSQAFLAKCKSGTTDEENVRGRIREATDALASV